MKYSTMKKIYLTLLSAFLLSGALFAQVSQADFDRVETLRRNGEKVYHDAVTANWIGDTPHFYYVDREQDGMKFYLVNASTGKKTAAFDQQKFADALSKAVDSTIRPYQLPLRAPRFADDVKSFSFDFRGFEWNYLIKENKLSQKGKVTPPPAREYWGSRNRGKERRLVHSPDSAWTAVNQDNNIWLVNRRTGEQTQLSFNGSPGDYYSSNIVWSPDSKKIAAMQIRDAAEHLIYFVESSPKTQLQPILHNRNYYKPGDALPISRPRLFDVATKKQVPVNALAYENQYSVGDVRWWKDSRAFTFEFNQRGHQAYQVAEVNAATGAIRNIVDEQCKTFFDYSGKKYRYDFSDGKEMIWRSERDGWNHLYLYDVATGRVKNQITKGEYVVRTVEEVDEKNRTILFTANGYDALKTGEDPYNIHLFRINMDGTGLIKLTSEEANHRFTFSRDKKFFVDVYSRPDMPPVSVLRSTSDGKIILEIEKADISALRATGWVMPEVFHAKGRDGVTDIWGTIFFPTNFDRNKKYPVVEYIYAGPHGSHVVKNFVVYSQNFSRLADLGCIIVSIDGMGTSNRSKAFHDVCWQDLKDAGFPDRILWMKAAAATRPYMDLDRVGIFGTSAGGQNALGALLFHGDFYKVGSASCGCHDNRMDKIWWNEQWMGFPIGKHYEESSNVVNAHKLQGKLLLMVGELDDNVDPATTMQVVDELIKAKKEFEFIVLPGLNHTGGGEYGMWRMHNFFVRNLFGQTTPNWNSR